LILLRPSYFRIDIDPLPVLLERSLDKRGKPVPAWVKRWSQIAQMSAPEKAYRQLGHAIKLLGHPLNRAQTPAERAQASTNTPWTSTATTSSMKNAPKQQPARSGS